MEQEQHGIGIGRWTAHQCAVLYRCQCLQFSLQKVMFLLLAKTAVYMYLHHPEPKDLVLPYGAGVLGGKPLKSEFDIQIQCLLIQYLTSHISEIFSPSSKLNINLLSA
ncbi:MAG: hypothetical protein GX763_06105 [Clostridiaceae bacterium]|nr:hypothetical protein [Clostridiaceae bacterium]